MDERLPPEVRRLIDEALPSIDHVEVLYRVGGATAARDALARETRLDAATLARVLGDLVAAGLVVEAGAGFRLTENPRQRAAVAEFVAAYNARPLAVVRALYSRASPLRTFADAFRLRRGD